MKKNRLGIVRWLLSIFIIVLVLSGITAFKLESELNWILAHMDDRSSTFAQWLVLAHEGVQYANTHYPFLSYGTDWLAYAHIVIAVAFIGPLIDPVKNVWVIKFGIIACAGIIPLALIAGQIRSIPNFWIVIDCSFGVLGCIPLIWSLVLTNKMIKETSNH